MKSIINIPSGTIFNFTHNTEYTKPTGIKYGYSGTSVNQNESVTGNVSAKAPNKSNAVTFSDFYKYLTFTGIDNKGASNIYVTLYDENGNVVKSESLVNKNAVIDMFNNDIHAKKFSIRSSANPSSGSVKIDTRGVYSSSIANSNYNKITITSIKDRFGRNYSNVTAWLLTYPNNTQVGISSVMVNANKEVTLSNIKEIRFSKNDYSTTTVNYSGTSNGSIIATGSRTEITINSFTNCNYINVALLKSNNAKDIISTYKITKATHIPLTADTKYVSISIPNTDSKNKKVNYTLWYQNLTISYKLDSLTSVTYKAYGKIEESNIENIVGTLDYVLDVSALNYPAELENQEEGAKLIAQDVLNKINFPFLIF